MSGIKKFDHVDNMFRYDENYAQLKDFEITEKLDGANFRFWKGKDGHLHFGSRNVDDINEEATGSSGNSMKMFKPYMEFVREKTNNGEKIAKGFVFFCEAMMPHKIKYRISNDNLVIGFAIYDTKYHKYNKAWKSSFLFFDIPTVHEYSLSDFGDAKNAVELHTYLSEHYDDFKSHVDGESSIEGVFLKDYDTKDSHNRQVMYKSKTPRYMDIAREESLENMKISSVDMFFSKYVTYNRIESKIDVMRVEGKYNKKNPLASLTGYVLNDIFLEATVRDLVKAFAQNKGYEYNFRQAIIQKILADDLLMRKVMELKM